MQRLLSERNTPHSYKALCQACNDSYSTSGERIPRVLLNFIHLHHLVSNFNCKPVNENILLQLQYISTPDAPVSTEHLRLHLPTVHHLHTSVIPNQYFLTATWDNLLYVLHGNRQRLGVETWHTGRT